MSDHLRDAVLELLLLVGALLVLALMVHAI
jgi:hypothetical protein